MQGQEPTAEEVDLEKSMRTTRPLMVGGKGRACASWLTGGSDLIRRGIRSRPWCFRSGPSKAAYLAAWCRNHKQLDSFPSLSSSFPSVASVRLGEASVRFGQVRPSVGCFFCLLVLLCQTSVAAEGLGFYWIGLFGNKSHCRMSVFIFSNVSRCCVALLLVDCLLLTEKGGC